MIFLGHMKNVLPSIKYSSIVLACLLFFFSCTHDPIDSGIVNPKPIDTIVPPKDTLPKPMPKDSSILSICDSSLIYFNKDILPIFANSCAIVGCHDARSAVEGYQLTDYKSIIQRGLVSGKPNSSKIFTVITSGNTRSIMPPPPYKALTTKQIELIDKWITGGLKPDSCISKSICDTSIVSFSMDILPVFENYCTGCHGAINSYSGVRLHNYSNVKSAVSTGRLLGSLRWVQGYIAMPQDQPQLLGCDIKKIEIWIRKGGLNN